MNRATQVPAQGIDPGVPNSYRARADHGNNPCFIFYHRARGQRSVDEKARSKQYLIDLLQS